MLYFRVTARDKNRKLFKDKTGAPISMLNIDEPKMELAAKMAIQARCKEISNFVISINPQAYVEVEVLVHNSISGTYMAMHTYYGNGGLFVSH